MRNQHRTLNNGGFMMRHLDCTHYLGLCIGGVNGSNDGGGVNNFSPQITSVQFGSVLENEGSDTKEATTSFLMTFANGTAIEARVPVAAYLDATLSNLPEFSSDEEAIENPFLDNGDWYRLSTSNVYGETETFVKRIT